MPQNHSNFFESVQNLLSFLIEIFVSVVLNIIFVAKADIVLNLFLRF